MKKVLLLLAQGFEAYEASVFTDVLGWSSAYGDLVEVVTAGRRMELKCTWGFTVIPRLQVEQVRVEDFHALAIPGGFEMAGFYEDAYSEDFLNLIREFDRGEKIIASICVGALPLGKSGVLKGKKGTTYSQDGGVRRKQLADFGVQVETENLVVDDRIITSASPATAINVAFYLLEMLSSPENCSRVRKMMGF